jgi:hypothetical protein
MLACAVAMILLTFHVFNLMPSPSAMPQQAQHIMSAADDSKLFVQLIVYQSPPMLRCV